MTEKLALLARAIADVRNASVFNKADAAEHALAIAVDLIGELVDRIEALEKKVNGNS